MFTKGNGAKARAGLVRAFGARQGWAADARHWPGRVSRDYRLLLLGEGREKTREAVDEAGNRVEIVVRIGIAPAAEAEEEMKRLIGSRDVALSQVWARLTVCFQGTLPSALLTLPLTLPIRRQDSGFWPLATAGDWVAKWKKVPGLTMAVRSRTSAAHATLPGSSLRSFAHQLPSRIMATKWNPPFGGLTAVRGLPSLRGVKIIRAARVLLVGVGCVLGPSAAGTGLSDKPATGAAEAPAGVRAPSGEELSGYDLDPGFYRKCAMAGGILIATSERVADLAILETAWQFEQVMTRLAEPVAQRIRARRPLCILIGHNELTSDLPQFGTDKRGEERDFYNWRQRGFLTTLGGRPTVVFAEEDVMEYEGGMQLESNDHNHIHTRAQLLDYDPGLAALCREVLGDSPWRFVSPRERAGQGHLATYDPAQAPKVADAPHIMEAANDYYDRYWADYWQRLYDKHGIQRPADGMRQEETAGRKLSQPTVLNRIMQTVRFGPRTFSPHRQRERESDAAILTLSPGRRPCGLKSALQTLPPPTGLKTAGY